MFGELETFMVGMKPETVKFCLDHIDKDAFFPSRNKKDDSPVNNFIPQPLINQSLNQKGSIEHSLRSSFVSLNNDIPKSPPPRSPSHSSKQPSFVYESDTESDLYGSPDHEELVQQLRSIVIKVDRMGRDQRNQLQQKLKSLLGHRNKISSANQFNQLSTIIKVLTLCDENIDEETTAVYEP